VTTLSILDLVLAASLVVALAILSILTNMGFARSLLIASLRTAIQLSMIGLVLKFVFENADYYWVGLITLVMLLLAGREVNSRQKHRLKGYSGYFIGLAAMTSSSFLLTLLTLIFLIQNDPWYAPQYAIPLLGMTLGNAMNGIALSLDSLTRNAVMSKNIIETKLALGFTAGESILEIKREAIRVGLIPIINAMVAAGIISLPGMMTGQILAGIDPWEAVKYQILIMFLISAAAGLGSLVAVNITALKLFDLRDRLRLDKLS